MKKYHLGQSVQEYGAIGVLVALIAVGALTGLGKEIFNQLLSPSQALAFDKGGGKLDQLLGLVQTPSQPSQTVSKDLAPTPSAPVNATPKKLTYS